MRGRADLYWYVSSNSPPVVANDLGMAEVDRTASGDPATKQSTPMLARPEGEEVRPKWSHRNVFELGCACVGMIAA